MDSFCLPQYPVDALPPARTAITRLIRLAADAIWSDALFLVLTTAAAAAPSAALVAFLESLNDKPGGDHTNSWTYPKVIVIAAMGASLAALAARAVGRPRTFEARVFVPLLFGGLAVVAVCLTVCLWMPWVFDGRVQP